MICPYCRTENAPGATRCASCTSWMVERPPVREWTRAREGRWLGGVARGLSNRFGVSCAALRAAFVVSLLLGGWGLVVYVVLWIVMPEEPLALPPHVESAPREPAGARPGS